jgi:hypothetical protein
MSCVQLVLQPTRGHVDCSEAIACSFPAPPSYCCYQHPLKRLHPVSSSKYRPAAEPLHSVSAQGLGRLQDSAFGDLIVPIIVLLLCLVSLGIGIGKVVNNASGVR